MVEERRVQWDEIGVKVEEVKEEMEAEVELMVVKLGVVVVLMVEVMVLMLEAMVLMVWPRWVAGVPWWLGANGRTGSLRTTRGGGVGWPRRYAGFYGPGRRGTTVLHSGLGNPRSGGDWWRAGLTGRKMGGWLVGFLTR